MNSELVSTDIIGNEGSSIFDSPATIVSKDGKNIRIPLPIGSLKDIVKLSIEPN